MELQDVILVGCVGGQCGLVKVGPSRARGGASTGDSGDCVRHLGRSPGRSLLPLPWWCGLDLLLAVVGCWRLMWSVAGGSLSDSLRCVDSWARITSRDVVCICVTRILRLLLPSIIVFTISSSASARFVDIDCRTGGRTAFLSRLR